MEQNKSRQKNTFRTLERMLTRVIFGTLALFLLMLICAATGIGWLKWMLGITWDTSPISAPPRFQ